MLKARGRACPALFERTVGPTERIRGLPSILHAITPPARSIYLAWPVFSPMMQGDGRCPPSRAR
jgi:hypothetical protein